MLQSEIVGSVKMKVRLTGMPELRLGLNDKILFENTGSELSPPPCLTLHSLPCCRDKEQGSGAGGCEVSPVCPSLSV